MNQELALKLPEGATQFVGKLTRITPLHVQLKIIYICVLGLSSAEAAKRFIDAQTGNDVIKHKGMLTSNFSNWVSRLISGKHSSDRFLYWDPDKLPYSYAKPLRKLARNLSRLVSRGAPFTKEKLRKAQACLVKLEDTGFKDALVKELWRLTNYAPCRSTDAILKSRRSELSLAERKIANEWMFNPVPLPIRHKIEKLSAKVSDCHAESFEAKLNLLEVFIGLYREPKFQDLCVSFEFNSHIYIQLDKIYLKAIDDGVELPDRHDEQLLEAMTNLCSKLIEQENTTLCSLFKEKESAEISDFKEKFRLVAKSDANLTQSLREFKAQLQIGGKPLWEINEKGKCSRVDLANIHPDDAMHICQRLVISPIIVFDRKDHEIRKLLSSTLPGCKKPGYWNKSRKGIVAKLPIHSEKELFKYLDRYLGSDSALPFIVQDALVWTLASRIFNCSIQCLPGGIKFWQEANLETALKVIRIGVLLRESGVMPDSCNLGITSCRAMTEKAIGERLDFILAGLRVCNLVSTKGSDLLLPSKPKTKMPNTRTNKLQTICQGSSGIEHLRAIINFLSSSLPLNVSELFPFASRSNVTVQNGANTVQEESNLMSLNRLAIRVKVNERERLLNLGIKSELFSVLAVIGALNQGYEPSKLLNYCLDRLGKNQVQLLLTEMGLSKDKPLERESNSLKIVIKP